LPNNNLVALLAAQVLAAALLVVQLVLARQRVLQLLA
jgi:hypothetical protein